MAKQPKHAQPQPLDPQTEAVDAMQDPDPQLPRPPQGIVVRNMETGDPKRDFITKFRRPRIDPASLVVDGQDPYLALPVDGNTANVRIRQIKADAASDLLSCDHATGAPSTYRLATDREVAAYHAAAKARTTTRGRF